MAIFEREKVIWAAAFFCGEGAIIARTNRTGLSLSVSQSYNPEVLYRFQDCVGGLGSVRGPYRFKRSKGPGYQWGVDNFEEVQAIIAAMWFWLSSAKKIQYMNALQLVWPIIGQPKPTQKQIAGRRLVSRIVAGRQRVSGRFV